MTFLIGLNKLNREEKISLLTQINVTSLMNLSYDEIQKFGKKTKEGIFGLLGKAVEVIPDNLIRKLNTEKEVIKNNLEKFDKDSDWDPNYIDRKLSEEKELLSRNSDLEIDALFKQKLFSIAELQGEYNDTLITNSILHKAASAMKIDIRLYSDSVSLENAVYEKLLYELIENLKAKLSSMSSEEEEKLEKYLREELKKLSDADLDSLKKMIGGGEITSKALLSFFKTTSSIALVQLALGGMGFGFYLFLSTFLKSIGLLLGVTFTFGTYTALTTVFGFILSVPFLIIAGGLSFGYLYNKTGKKLNDEFAKLLVLTGKSKIIG